LSADSETRVRRERTGVRELLSRVSRLEWAAAAVTAAVLIVLVALEPDILDAPFASTRAVLFTFGGSALAAIALVVMLRWRVNPLVRVVVLAVPFVAVQWWLISPFFIDDVVDQDFATSIAEQQAAVGRAPPSPSPITPTTRAPASAPTPALLGAGEFVGLAGHDGRGDAGVFRLENGAQVLRFENFDIENGPDLELYVVPGLDQRSIAAGSTHLGALQGNVGDQTYELPGRGLTPGDWTVLVWCEAFTVEFVAASLTIA
jgi:hypothetical protein